MKEASFSLAEAKFAMGDFNHLVLQNVSKAQLKVKLKKDNVAGFFCDVSQYIPCVTAAEKSNPPIFWHQQPHGILV